MLRLNLVRSVAPHSSGGFNSRMSARIACLEEEMRVHAGNWPSQKEAAPTPVTHCKGVHWKGVDAAEYDRS